jgi:hypothetical protein
VVLERDSSHPAIPLTLKEIQVNEENIIKRMEYDGLTEAGTILEGNRTTPRLSS